jgi:hypothetical protein
MAWSRKRVYKGWRGLVAFSDEEIGYCTEVSITVANNVEGYFEMGRRAAKELVEGRFEVTGNMRRFWVDKELANYAIGSNPTSLGVGTFDLWLYPAGQDYWGGSAHGAGNASGRPYVVVVGAKMDSITFDLSQDDFAANNVEFRARDAWAYGSGLLTSAWAT